MERNTIYEWEDVDIDRPFNLSEVIDGSGGSASTKEPSLSSSKPFIGLKLGKQTYFENSYTNNNNNNKISSVLECGKKVKSSCQSAPVSRCQVEGCNFDLSSAKGYHRRHNVCDSHSKCPKVVVAGIECRFCQKCSRFHSISEFDGKKRSCRERLSYHYARRRKLQQDRISFKSTSPFSSFGGAESIDVLSHLTGDPLSYVLNMSTHPRTSKGVRAEISDQVICESGGSASTKSSISASTESNYSFEGFGSFPDSYSQKEASVCSSEPFTGLKLGKRTYFENDYTNNKKTISSVLDSGKNIKSSCQSAPVSRCQVEGCNLDLSSAKEYYQRHGVCDSHSKCPKVVVTGVDCRFCQKCSRFHSMSEFDGKKRSCRERLSYHNARRRKLQQDRICFNSTIPFSSFDGAESIDVLSHPTGDPLSNVLNMSTHPRTSKSVRAEIFEQGVKESVSSNVDDIQGALSLLSNHKWGSYELDHSTMVQRGIHMGPQGSPLSSKEYWEPNLESIDPHNKIFKSAYKIRFCSSG